jgi:hypothetical protein
MKFEFEASSPNQFIRIKDGEKVVGVFRGDIFTFKDHWVGNRSSLCTEKPDCPLCNEGNKPKFRFHVNFLTAHDGKWSAKIFAGGWKLYQTLKNLHESDYNLEKTIVSITRQGSDTNTVYSVLPIKDYQVTDEREAILAEIPLVPLDKKLALSDAKEDDRVPF